MDKNNISAQGGEVKSSLVRMSDVKPKAVRWLWAPLVPQGKICLIRGDGSQGKTTLSLTLAAVVSTGGVLPCLDGDGEDDFVKVAAGNVLFVSAEDDLADTVRQEAAYSIAASIAQPRLSPQGVEVSLPETARGAIPLLGCMRRSPV